MMLHVCVKFHENRTCAIQEITTNERTNQPTHSREHIETVENKPVGDWTPRLAQISLPWQQGAASQHFAWFH